MCREKGEIRVKTAYDWIFVIFLGIAAVYDWRERKIPVWLFAGAGVLTLLIMIWKEDRGIWDVILGFQVGILLFLISKIVRGAIGEGDGIFFCISGILLGVEKNLLLLGGGVFVCGLYSVFLVLFGVLAHISVRKWRLPFLTFLFPVGIGVMLL